MKSCRRLILSAVERERALSIGRKDGAMEHERLIFATHVKVLLNRLNRFGVFSGSVRRRLNIGRESEGEALRGHIPQLTRPHTLRLTVALARNSKR
jgi:hypothetical protein